MQHNEPLGIFPPHEAFYIDCLLWHSTSAVRSITEVSEWIKLVKEDDPKFLDLPKPVLFDKLQNIVQQAAAISRYFWPSPRRPSPVHSARATRLTEAFEISKASPLWNRELRDGIEHFDERLDLYLAKGFAGEFIPDHVDYEEPKSEVPLCIFKAFYMNPLVFVLLGTRYEMTPLVNELLRIQELLEKFRNNFYRFPHHE